MLFYFHTKNIDKKLYKRAIWKYIIQNLPREYIPSTRLWEIKIYPAELASNDPFFHGQNGIGGVTGNKEVKLYINDVIGETPWFMSNMVVITHELAHMIGMILNWREKKPMRHDDYSGHKAGDMLNKWTQEIHDRHTENRFYTTRVHKYDRGLKKWFVYRKFRALDFRDNKV